MEFLIFISPNDFKDESVSAFKMFFERWGIKATITSYSTKECIGSHGAIYMPDINTNKIDPSKYNGIVLIDGPGIDTYKLQEFRPFFDILTKFNSMHKYIISIGNSQKISAKANILRGKKVAVPADKETQRTVELFHGIASEKDVEIDGNIISFKSTNAIEDNINSVLEHIGVK
jgi:hypothetical protein